MVAQTPKEGSVVHPYRFKPSYMERGAASAGVSEIQERRRTRSATQRQQDADCLPTSGLTQIQQMLAVPNFQLFTDLAVCQRDSNGAACGDGDRQMIIRIKAVILRTPRVQFGAISPLKDRKSTRLNSSPL